MRTIAVLSMLVLPALARAGAPEDWAGGGRVEYVLVHKFHTIVGACPKVEARASFEDGGDGTGSLRMMARAPVACFDSGNQNRDSNAMATVDAGKHPLVIVKGIARGVKLPPTGKATFRFDASIELKGMTVSHPIDVVVERVDGGSVTATFDFRESLAAHQVERPSLLMVKVEDELRIRGALTLERAR